MITAEEPVTDRDDIVKKTRGQEEENKACKYPGYEPRVVIDRSCDSGC
jgi:hypothetical protein